jgi:hypothetical protein
VRITGWSRGDYTAAKRPRHAGEAVAIGLPQFIAGLSGGLCLAAMFLLFNASVPNRKGEQHENPSRRKQEMEHGR